MFPIVCLFPTVITILCFVFSMSCLHCSVVAIVVVITVIFTGVAAVVAVADFACCSIAVALVVHVTASVCCYHYRWWLMVT